MYKVQKKKQKETEEDLYKIFNKNHLTLLHTRQNVILKKKGFIRKNRILSKAKEV